jgi:CheY-like chemotaxis protein
MSTSRTVLLVCGDLFFGTKLRSEIESAGLAVELEPLPERALAKAPLGRYQSIVIDLESPGLNLPALLAALPADHRPKVIAFGPHVHKERLESARAAGCDQVLSRGQIAASIREVVSS